MVKSATGRRDYSQESRSVYQPFLRFFRDRSWITRYPDTIPPTVPTDSGCDADLPGCIQSGALTNFLLGDDPLTIGTSASRAVLVSLISTHLRMAHYPGLRCGRVLDPNVARPLSRAATMINVRGRGTFSSFVAVRRTMSYSCRRAASGSIRDARLAGA
jgi:hypothetical protein